MTLPLPETAQGALNASAFKKIKDFSGKVDVLAIGPGLGRERSTRYLIRKLVSKIKKPLVIDADALNALAGHLDILPTGEKVILTPHPGEMSGLTGVTTPAIQKNRKKVAQNFVNRYNVILVLKGHRSLVARKQKSPYVNNTGNPGMAKAGSGDVLTGMIAAFLAQGLSGFESGKYAVYLHGLSGNLAARKKTQIAMAASDIIDNIPGAIKKCS